MKKASNPILPQIRGLEVGQYVDLPRCSVGAINAAIYYITSSDSRKFSRILQADKVTYRVTRIE